MGYELVVSACVAPLVGCGKAESAGADVTQGFIPLVRFVRCGVRTGRSARLVSDWLNQYGQLDMCIPIRSVDLVYFLRQLMLCALITG